MATPSKKSKLEERDARITHFSSKSEVISLESTLNAFILWCHTKHFNLNKKVTVTKGESSCAQYGMVALLDLGAGEVLFEVPRPVLLHPKTSSISAILQQGTDELQSQSGWVPLLLTLMYEYTNQDSEWRPYLDLCPDFNELDQPMFWTRNEIQQKLHGTGIAEAVVRDEDNILNEYQSIVLPYMKKHSGLFSLKTHTFELYKKMVAFVMAYSFTEPPSHHNDDDDDSPPMPPMMVAMADILNHVSKNNAKLKFGKECLRMVTTRKIAKGEEVYNTYGEMANWQLLHMYGFAEPYPNNIYDTVDIPMSLLYKCASAADGCNKELLQEKWTFLQDINVVSDDGAFIIGVNGVLTEVEMETTLKVLCMSSPEFQEYKDNEGWSSDEESNNENMLTNDGIPQLPSPWKTILSKCVKESLTRYKDTLSDDEARMNPESFNTLTSRQQFALYVRIGQKKLLHKFLELADR